jgi:hypothetical protein
VSDPQGDGATTSFAQLYDGLANDLGGVAAMASTAGASVYRRADRDFAVVDGTAIEVRLQPEVAEAVLRTPHTSRSPRGPGWIRFEPPRMDPSIVDRADAWFRSAWRTAER